MALTTHVFISFKIFYAIYSDQVFHSLLAPLLYKDAVRIFVLKEAELQFLIISSLGT